MSGETEKEKGSKPDVVLRGKNTFLSVWFSGNRLRITVTKRGDNGAFERVDDYVVNLDYLLFVAIRHGQSRDVVSSVCELMSSLAESEDHE